MNTTYSMSFYIFILFSKSCQTEKQIIFHSVLWCSVTF